MTHKGLSKYLFWAVLALPAAYMTFAYATGELTYGQTLALSGDIAVKLLIVALAVTPIRLSVPQSALSKWLVKSRRAIGIAVFAYASFHLWVYLARKADIIRIIDEGLGLDILTGWAAFFIFVPLALTSNNRSVRGLKKNWKRLHRWIYPATALVLLHWVLTAFNPLTACMHIGILGLLEGYRVIKQRSG